ncbi:MAG TPA: hypothetical protein VGK74_06545 [Symbiobacteriaceae bacterium]|jgi:hypothetical protein
MAALDICVICGQTEIEAYIVPPVLGNAAGVLGGPALAERA